MPEREGGFTLLEVLIAVSVFAIVLAAVNTIFYAALRLRNRTTESIERALPVTVAVETIKRDLAGLVPPGGTLSGELRTTLTTRGQLGQSSPEFHCASGRIDTTSPWAEVQRIQYVLADSTNRLGSRDLYRMVERNLLPSSQDLTEPQRLLGGVESILFYYLDGTAWKSAWDSSGEDSGLPTAIKVQIALETEAPAGNALSVPAPIEIVVPVVSQSLTNLNEEAGEE